MSRKLILAVVLAAVPLGAQALGREPAVVIDLNDPAHLRAWLSLAAPVPKPLAQAFALTIGCPLAADRPYARSSTAVQVDCPAHMHQDGLRSTTHWDFTALNAALGMIGARNGSRRSRALLPVL